MKRTIMSFLIVALSATASFAASLESLQVRELNKIAVSKHSAYNAGNVMTIYYVGSSTASDINVAATVITAQTPLGTADADFSFAFATYDTMGELCLAIDALDDFKCVLDGAKADDSSYNLQLLTASSSSDAKANGGYGLKWSTGTAAATDTDPYKIRLGITPQDGRRAVLKSCVVQNDGTGTFLVYGKLAKYEGVSDGVTRNDTTLVWNVADVDDTEKTIDFTTSGAGGLEFAKDEHVVVSIGNATTAQTATSGISCKWEEK